PSVNVVYLKSMEAHAFKHDPEAWSSTKHAERAICDVLRSRLSRPDFAWISSSTIASCRGTADLQPKGPSPRDHNVTCDLHEWNRAPGGSRPSPPTPPAPGSAYLSGVIPTRATWDLCPAEGHVG